MKKSALKVLPYLPLALGVTILVVGSFFVPWRDVLPYFAKMSLITYSLLLLLGIAFYFSRIIRYKYMLSTLSESRSLKVITLSYLVAQPVSLLPAGEMYRSVMLKKHGDVPMISGLPVVFIQSLTENIGLVVLALVGAIVIHQYILLVLIVAIAYTLVVVVIRRRKSVHRSHKVVKKLPFITIKKSKLVALFRQKRTLLKGKSLWVLIGTSFVSSLIASFVLFVTAQSFGVELTFFQAAIAFAVPMVIQNLTFLPGGIGVNEQSSVGILVVFGVNLPAAVALTVVLRFMTLGMGVALGLIAVAYIKLGNTKT